MKQGSFCLMIAILSLGLAGCSRIDKPGLAFKNLELEELDNSRYEIHSAMGKAQSWYVFFIPFSKDGWGPQGWTYPFRIGPLTPACLESQAVYKALDNSGADIMLPYTRRTRSKGFFPVWHVTVNINGKAITLKTDD